MSIRCPACGREYDVTLFQFGQGVRCECGREISLSHRMEVDDRPEPRCEINVQRTQGVSVVELRGELRLETSAYIEASLRPVSESPGVGVVLDFGEVTYVTSSALHVIVEAWNVLERRGIPMVLSSLHGNVKRVFDVVHLTENLRVFESRQVAVEYLVGQAGQTVVP